MARKRHPVFAHAADLAVRGTCRPGTMLPRQGGGSRPKEGNMDEWKALHEASIRRAIAAAEAGEPIGGKAT